MKPIDTRGLWNVGLILFSLCSGALAQTSYIISASTANNAPNTVDLTINLRRGTGGDYELGPTTLVLDVHPKCLNVSALTSSSLVNVAGNFWSGAPYQSISVTGVITDTNRARINLNLNTNGTVGGDLVTIAPRQFAVIRIPTTGDCGCTPAQRNISLNTTLSTITANVVPTFPASGNETALGALTNFTLQPIITPASAAPIVICDVPEVRTYNTDRPVRATPPGFVLRSSVGSVIQSQTATSVTVLHAIPNFGVARDTLLAFDASNSACAAELVVNSTGPPIVSFPLRVTDNRTSRCNSDFPLQIRQDSTEAGVQYQLLVNGVATGLTHTGVVGGGPFVWSVSSPVGVVKSLSNTDSVYSYSYTASRAGCVRSQPIGLTINTFNCTLSPQIQVTTSLCAGASGTATIQPASIAALLTDEVAEYTWSTNSPYLTFVGSNVGTSVNFTIGNPPSNQTIRLFLTERRRLVTAVTNQPSRQGSDFIDINVTARTPLTIAGPSFVFNPGGFVDRQFTVPNNATFTVTPSTGFVPFKVIDGATEDVWQVTFPPTGTYTVRIDNSLVNPTCPTVTERVIQVVDADLNPGTAGPSQVVCVGNRAVVYTLDESGGSAITGDLRWQVFRPGLGWVDETTTNTIGVTAQVHLTRPFNDVSEVRRYRLKASNGVDSVFSAEVQVSVSVRSSPGVVTPPAPSICSNGSDTLTVSGGTGALFWQQSSNGVTWLPALGSGINASTFVTANLTGSTFFRAGFANGCDTSYSVVLVDVSNDPLGSIATLAPGANALCYNPATLTTPNAPRNQSAALVTTASFGAIGTWVNTTYPPSVTPNTPVQVGPNQWRYNAAAEDANHDIVRLAWVVSNGNCTPSVSYQEIEISKPLGVVVSPLPTQTLCAGSTTSDLDVTVTGNTSNLPGYWVARYANSRSAPRANGFFTLDSTRQQVRYVSSTADAGRTVFFFYIIPTGLCDTFSNSVLTPVSATFSGEQILGRFNLTSTSNICFAPGVRVTGFVQAASFAPSNPRMLVDGQLNANVVITPIVGSDSASFSYPIQDADIGRTLTFTYQVTSGACTPLEITRTVTIERPPRSSVSQSTAIICEGTSVNITGTAVDGFGAWVPVTTGGFATPPGTAWGTSGPTNNILTFTGITAPDTRNQVYRFEYQVNSAISSCSQAVSSVTITVTSNPAGTITYDGGAAAICAGALSDTLRGTILPTGALATTGRWFTPNGTGTFSDTLASKVRYNSDVADGSLPGPVRIQYIISNAGCGSTVLEYLLNVDPSLVNGSFNGQQPDGSLTPVCYPATSTNLNATVTAPTTGSWSVTDGAGTFRSIATGNPTTTDPQAVYVPDVTDIGKTIFVTWNLTRGVSGCANANISRPMRIRGPVEGNFQAAGIICYNPPLQVNSGPLAATINGDTSKPLRRRWVALPATPTGYVPQGGFTVYNDSNYADAQYLAAAADVDQTFQIGLELDNGVCPVVTATRTVRVAGATSVTYRIYRYVNQQIASGPISFPIPTGINFCERDTFLMVGLGAQSYSYDEIGSNVFRLRPASITNDSMVVVLPAGTANYRVNVRGNIGSCTFGQSFDFPISPGAPFVVRRVDGQPLSTSICQQSSVDIFIAAPGGGPPPLAATPNILWRQKRFGIIEPIPSDRVSNITNDTIRLIPEKNIQYNVRFLTSNGCYSEVDISFQIDNETLPFWQVPQVCLADTTGASDTLVVNGNLPASAPPGATAWWFFQPPNFPLGVNPNPSLPTFVGSGNILRLPLNNPRINRNSDNNILTLVYNNGTCITYTADTFAVRPKPEADFVMAGQRLNDLDQVVPNNPTDFDSVAVTVPFFNPVVNFQYNGADASAIDVFLWDFGDPASGINNNDSNQIATHRFSTSGVYSVVLYIVNDNGCTDLILKPNAVTVREEDYSFPNAFTPNGDGNNDVFRPLPTRYDLPTASRVTRANLRLLQIIDRWGALVYESTTTDGWDGTNTAGPGGTPFEGGTYSYRAEILLQNNTIRTYTGYVNLIR